MNLTTIGIMAGAVLFAIIIIGYGIGFIRINTDEGGIVEKWWSFKGSIKDGIIALKGESGYQPEVLRNGVHFRTPFKYRVKKVRLVTVPQGQVAYVFARSGETLQDGQTLGKLVPECNSFQNAAAFLVNGGQKGPQRQLLREGTYAFNLAQFIIITKDKIYSIYTSKEESAQIESMRTGLQTVRGFEPVKIGAVVEAHSYDDDGNVVMGVTQKNGDTIGIVTVNEGPTPDGGAIIAPAVGSEAGGANYHNNFQEPEKFLAAGGRKGKQMQVLTDGVYFINRLFASMDIVPKTIIEIGYAGVVVSYFGEKGVDVSGTEYSHGELVADGTKGIWKNAILPGKYAFNTYAGKVIPVPTTNIILKWISGTSGEHKLDANLKEISLITKDAFEPNLPLTVVCSIDYRKASSVIQRFGNIKTLIEQSLDPMIAGYFKNIGQTKTLIELVQDRSEIQIQASTEMKAKFAGYDLELQEVLIGTPAASAADTRIEKILAQLRDREVAKEEIKTNEAKQLSAEKQRELAESQAKAAAQPSLTQSSIDIQVADNKGKSELRLAEQLALKTQELAKADRFKREQEADAAKYTKIAEAEASARAITVNAVANAEQVKVAADAEAHKLTVTGNAQATNIKAIADAEAERERKVGQSKGTAAKALVDAYGGPELQVQQSVMTAFAEALKVTKAQLVPNTIIGAQDGKSTNALESIMSIVLTNMVTNGETGLSKTHTGSNIVDIVPAATSEASATKESVVDALSADNNPNKK